MAFGKNLKSVRLLKGWTQQEAADKIQTKRFNISAYEEGRSTPPYDVLKRIIDVFQIPEDKVVHFIFGNLETSDLNDERPGTSYIRLMQRLIDLDFTAEYMKDPVTGNLLQVQDDLYLQQKKELQDKITVARAMLNLKHPEFANAL